MPGHALHIALAALVPVVIILAFLAYDRRVERRDAEADVDAARRRDPN